MQSQNNYSRRGRRRGPRTNLPLRTYNNVDTAFRRMRVSQTRPFTGLLPNYIQCRLNPFGTALSGQGTPDDAMVSRIVVDHRDFCTLTIGADGSCQVRLFPCLPIPLAFKPSAGWAGYAVNGASLAAITAPTTVAASNTGWYPLINITEWVPWLAAASLAPISEVPGPYFEVKARIVALATKVYYTGQASTASGTITFTADRSVCSAFGGTQKSVTIFNQGGGTGAVTAYPVTLDFGSVVPTLDASSITERPEAPMRVVPRRADDLMPWIDRTQLPIMPVDAGTGDAVFTANVAGYYPLIGLYDEGWEIACITFAGVTPGSTFRLETAVCVEYQPMATSTVAKLGKKPSKVAGKDNLSSVNAALSRQPIAVSDTAATPVNAILAEASNLVSGVTAPPSVPNRNIMGRPATAQSGGGARSTITGGPRIATRPVTVQAPPRKRATRGRRGGIR